MTEYDLETKKALRRVSLLEYGFGPETLWGRKICPACGSKLKPGAAFCTQVRQARPVISEKEKDKGY